MAVATRDIRNVRMTSPFMRGPGSPVARRGPGGHRRSRASSPPARDHCPPRDKATGRSRVVGGAVSRHRLSVGVGAAHAGARHRRVYRCVDLARGAVRAVQELPGSCQDTTADDQWFDGVGVVGGMGDHARGTVRPSEGPGPYRGLVGRRDHPQAAEAAERGYSGSSYWVWVLGQHAGPSSRVTSRPTS